MLRRSALLIGAFPSVRMALAALLTAAACGSSPAPSTSLPTDSGPPCDPGTRACICTTLGTCNDDSLICITGRCFDTEGTPLANNPNSPSGHPRPPTVYALDAGATAPLRDAGGLPDAAAGRPQEPDASSGR
jgi:hypothetical protein